MAAASPDGLIFWYVGPDAVQLQVGGEHLVPPHSSVEEVDLAQSALCQLVSMGFVRRECGSYRVTALGRNFAGGLAPTLEMTLVS